MNDFSPQSWSSHNRTYNWNIIKVSVKKGVKEVEVDIIYGKWVKERWAAKECLHALLKPKGGFDRRGAKMK